MIRKIFKFLKVGSNTLLFLLLSALTANILWIYFGQQYIYSKPVGGDYFNALNYLIFFSNNLTSPVSSWLNLFNEGSPVIGGYPFLPFYLASMLTKTYSYATAMNIYSFSSLLLFFISSLLLFWQTAKSWPIAFSFTLALIATRASYYQLSTGGFIAAASAQFYLPLVLFLIYRFGEKYKKRYLISASILTGISLIHQGSLTLLTVLLPSILALLLQNHRKETVIKKLHYLLVYLIISCVVGAIGLYTVFLQTFLGSGRSACSDTQCWGEYPKHLIVWLSPLAPIAAVSLFTLAGLLKVIKRNINLVYPLPAFVCLLFFVFYALVAHAKLINGLSNVIFPTRIFWAANLLILVFAASSFYSIRRALPKYSHLVSTLCATLIILIVILKPPAIHTDRPSTTPSDIAIYTISEFREKPIEELVPNWILKGDQNARIDIFNANVYQWFNIISPIPTTKGYSNHPLGVHQDWQYFLQTSTRNVPKEINQDLAKNRALFLLDAFGAKYAENSQIPLLSSILNDQTLIKKQEKLRDLVWLELSDNFTPIVSPTNSKAVLFIGTDSAYESFIRSLAMVNLNSTVLIPVKGPESLKSISNEDLAGYQVVFLYQYKNSGLSKLSSFIQNGGSVFVDTGTSNNIPKKDLESIFPTNSLVYTKTQNSAEFSSTQSELLKNIDVNKFSSLSYKNGPWKISYAKELKPWAKPALLQNNQTVIAEGTLSAGKIIWSGFNLPFHLVNNDNYEEARLLKNIILDLMGDTNYQKTNFKVERLSPNQISIVTTNATGIYFKENYDPGWKAHLGNKELQVTKAGLEFMYVSVPKDFSGMIKLEYKGSKIARTIVSLSIIGMVCSLIYLLIPNTTEKILKKSYLTLKNKLTKRVEKILEDEVHDR